MTVKRQPTASSITATSIARFKAPDEDMLILLDMVDDAYGYSDLLCRDLRPEGLLDMYEIQQNKHD